MKFKAAASASIDKVSPKPQLLLGSTIAKKLMEYQENYSSQLSESKRGPSPCTIPRLNTLA